MSLVKINPNDYCVYNKEWKNKIPWSKVKKDFLFSSLLDKLLNFVDPYYENSEEIKNFIKSHFLKDKWAIPFLYKPRNTSFDRK